MFSVKTLTLTLGLVAGTTMATPLVPRADCRAIRVQPGQNCASLANACGITQNNLMSYNPSPNFCSNLASGQLACCTPGTLPNINPTPTPGANTPQPNAHGICYKVQIKAGDTCWAIGQYYNLTPEQIEGFNSGPSLLEGMQQHVGWRCHLPVDWAALKHLLSIPIKLSMLGGKRIPVVIPNFMLDMVVCIYLYDQYLRYC